MGYLEFWGFFIGLRVWDVVFYGGLLRLSCGLDKWEVVVGWGEIFFYLFFIELELLVFGFERRFFFFFNLCYGLLEVMKEVRYCCLVLFSFFIMINSILVFLWGIIFVKSCVFSDRIIILDVCFLKGKLRDGCEIFDGWMRCFFFRFGSFELMIWMERMVGRFY